METIEIQYNNIIYFRRHQVDNAFVINQCKFILFILYNTNVTHEMFVENQLTFRRHIRTERRRRNVPFSSIDSL